VKNLPAKAKKGGAVWREAGGGPATTFLPTDFARALGIPVKPIDRARRANAVFK